MEVHLASLDEGGKDLDQQALGQFSVLQTPRIERQSALLKDVLPEGKTITENTWM